MSRGVRLFQPSEKFSFGRDELCSAVVRGVRESRCVLLFGGRLSGKTTVLMRISHLLGSERVDVEQAGIFEVPIFVDLSSLPTDATALDLFHRLAKQAQSACKNHIKGYPAGELPSEKHSGRDSLSAFRADLEAIINAAAPAYVRLVFLIDEAKRILGFGRGLQDNLYSLLYTGDRFERGELGLVLTGAQDLYEFCVDSTSPIGTRANQVFIESLQHTAVEELLAAAWPAADATAVQVGANILHDRLGGHAGLTTMVAFRAPVGESFDEAALRTSIQDLRRQASEVFRLWTVRMSPAAQVGLETLAHGQQVQKQTLIQLLQRKNIDRFLAERAMDELVFTGVAARVSGDAIAPSNRLYLEFVREHLVEDDIRPTEREVWEEIQFTELSMRKLVRDGYARKWKSNADHQIEKALGPAAWTQVQDNRSKHLAQYPLTPVAPLSEILDYCYLGQVGQLMISNAAWEIFRHLFRDKRQLEDLLGGIKPVRNDSAHFRQVPERELHRCKLACGDLQRLISQGLKDSNDVSGPGA